MTGIKYDKYFSSEIEKNSIKVTQYNYPNTIQLGDILELKGKNLPKISLLIGGSPCQSFSKSISSNTGFDGKSKLFFEFIRIKNEVNPKYFLLENVEMKKEYEKVITNLMGVEPVFINSERFSAQSRPRLYWTNIDFDRNLPTNSQVLKDILEDNVDKKYFYPQEYDFHGHDKVVCATLHINGHDILKRVNSPLHKCQTLTAVCGGNQQKKVLIDNRVRKLTPLEYERLQTIPYLYTNIMSDGNRYKAIGNGWTVDVIAHIFSGIKK
jgi:DNA (cytosine-5)-methyltransferase 3A